MSSSTKKYEHLIIPHIICPSVELSRPYISKIIENKDDYYRMYNINLDIVFDKFLPYPSDLRKLIIEFDLPELRYYSIEYYDFFEPSTPEHAKFMKFSEDIQSGKTDEKIYISTRPTVLLFPDLDYLTIKMLIDRKASLSIWTKIGKDKNLPYNFICEYKKIDEIHKSNKDFSLYHVMKKYILPSYFISIKNKEVEYIDNLVFEYLQNKFLDK